MMYKLSKQEKKKKFLIVKTSSLGDIIQAFGVLDYLHDKFEGCEIDWVVDKRFYSLVESHPKIHDSICYDIKTWKKRLLKKSTYLAFFKFIKNLRKKEYDIIFDIQGNCKSGLATLISRSKTKVGFGKKSVREWPNRLVTNIKIDVETDINMRLQYLLLLKKYFDDTNPIVLKGARLKINSKQKKDLDKLIKHPNLQADIKVMICSGSKWPNKQLPFETLCSFMKLIQKNLNACFLLVWGNDLEKYLSDKIHLEFKESSIVIDKLAIPVWQNLMNDMDLVVAMDSSSLHLCGTIISTPSFSVFGPTRPEVFKPIGDNHFALQGKCPYNITFDKRCVKLRSCPTGACIRCLKSDEIYNSFITWWKKLVNK